MSNDEIQRIRDYVYEKYVEGGHPTTPLDETAALDVLARHHRQTPISVDGDTYVLGVLYFELAPTVGDNEQLFLARAKTILEDWRARTKETWDVVDDRIDDATGFLEDMPEAERTKLFEKVRAELDGAAATQKKPAPEEPKGPVVQDGMVLIPAGAFLAGTAKSTRETKSYWIDVHPVTNADYRRFVEATGYRAPKFWPEGRFREPDAPVVGISWYDAYKYAAFVGKSLPTKDQWEKAARGRSGRIYPWGDEFNPELACYGREEGSDALDKVGQHPKGASEFGVQDMAGLVWEWTESPDPSDPEQRVICGGSYVDDESFLRCDEHLAANPKDKYDNIGFRCVRAPKE